MYTHHSTRGSGHQRARISLPEGIGREESTHCTLCLSNTRTKVLEVLDLQHLTECSHILVPDTLLSPKADARLVFYDTVCIPGCNSTHPITNEA